MHRFRIRPSGLRQQLPLGFALGLVAVYRARLARESRRFRVLADIAELAQGRRPVPELAQSLADLLVQRLVDVCVIDMFAGDGTVQREAVAVSARAGRPGELRDRLQRALEQPWDRTPDIPDRAREVAIDDPLARLLIGAEADSRLPGDLRLRSIVIVPLLGPRHPSGALILGTCPPRWRESRADDLEYFETLAGRVTLALQNASLSEELLSTEQQLDLILSTLDAGITVRDRDGRMVYANQAAADLLKLPDPEAVKSEPPGELMGRFDVYTEEGDPVDLSDLPGTRLLAGETMLPPLTVRNVVKATGEQRWLLNKATAVTDAQGRILMAVNLIDDVTETKRNEIAQSLLARAARAIAQAPDLPKTLQALAAAAVPGLADWASVDLRDPSGSIETVAIAHRDPEKVRLGWHLRTRWPVAPDDPEGLPAVIRTGEPQLEREIPDELLVAGARDAEHLELLRAVGLNSIMIAPIRAGSRTLGALSFVSSTSRRFDERDLQLGCDLGAQAGIIINHAQLHAEQAHIAHTLQAGLIPDSLPQFKGWRLSAAYRAAGLANEVGGDFYDVIEFDGGWVVVIGDVAGKGAQAAALTATARHTLAAITIATGDAGYAVEILNRRLREHGAAGTRLCTIAMAVVNDDRVTIISAGHPLPLLRRDGEVRPVGSAGPLLGFVDDPEIKPVEIEIRAGDELVLYTDGVLDAVGESGRFGEERLRAAMQSGSDAAAGADSAAHLLETIERFRAGEQTDDIAIVSLARCRVPVGAELGVGTRC